MDEKTLKLRLAECDRRAKELDAREKYVLDREDLLKTSVDITVVKETLMAKKYQLAIVEKKIDAAEGAFDQAVLERRGKLQRIDEQIEEVAEKLRIIRGKQNDATAKLGVIKSKSAELNAENANRRAYITEQDKLIADSIEEGNMSLRALKYEIDGLEEVKKTVNYEIAIITTSRNEVKRGLTEEMAELDDLRQVHDDTEQDLRKSLKILQNSIKEATTTNRQVAKDTKSKMDILRQKEEELLAKRGALKREQVELDTEKRRWNSTKDLYDL